MTKANDNYSHFTGTDHYYKYLFGYVVTDGVMELTQDYKSFWFLDIIASYGTHKKIKDEGFQVWKLKRIQDEQFRVVCEDGNNNVLIKQDIEYSDFKDDMLEMWCIDKVILLPSEY